MRKKYLYEYIFILLSLLVPVPGRFAYGIILIAALNLLVLAGTCFCRLVDILRLEDLKDALLVVFLISLSIIIKQWVTLLSPLASLTLGFQIYMPAVSAFFLGSLSRRKTDALLPELRSNMTQSAKFSGFMAFVFLFRDILGYGTFTFPVRGGISEIVIFKDWALSFLGVLWASVPGALIMCSALALLMFFITRKIKITEEIYDDAQ